MRVVCIKRWYYIGNITVDAINTLLNKLSIPAWFFIVVKHFRIVITTRIKSYIWLYYFVKRFYFNTQ